jgi:hypothetical protein
MTPLDVKHAAEIAIRYLTVLYDAQPLKNVRLEEVWLSEDEGYWYVTVGYDAPDAAQDPLAALRRPEREYKVFKIRAADGEVVEMKMRQL